MRYVAGLLLAVFAVIAPQSGAASASDLLNRQTDAERQQAALRERIEDLQKALDRREADRSEAVDALKASETAISRINRRLQELSADNARATADLASLENQIVQQQATMQYRRTELADQLRTQYTSGLSPWTALLSGDNPQELGRNLGYLGYVSGARVQAVQVLRTELERLAALQGRADARRTDIQRTVEETGKQKVELEGQQAERATLLAELEGQIAAQRAEARKLGQDDSRLSTLIGDLGKAITEQEEANRLAEAARLRERAARQAQEARLAQEAQARAQAERQAAAARAEAAAKAEAAAVAAASAAKTEELRLAAQAEREKAERAATVAREQVEAAQEREKLADQRARSAVALGDFGALRPVDQGSLRVVQPSEPPATVSVPATSLTPEPAAPAMEEDRPEQDEEDVGVNPPVASAEPPARRAVAAATGGGNGLRQGLTPPVRGAVQGRFGVGRPDGGVWRGIVLRTDAGTPVKAVASGTVVYASWLRGFGNLIIVDHGKQYMSVYAYNQSLLKQVGDAIAAGDTVATVGSTGGQVESGLYFEIRYRGTPVDPTKWLAL